jgi:hypothetical protein
MSTINDLSVASTVSPDDKFPAWQNANGVTRALPVSVLDGRYLMKGDIASLVGATVETFISDVLPNPDGLPTFTAGTSLALTLANLYNSNSNIEVFFDTSFQGPDQYNLIGFGLGFTSPIPLGVNRVYVRGSAASLVTGVSDGTITDASLAPGSNIFFVVKRTADPRAYGAPGDGINDDMPGLLRACAANPCVEFSPGTYVLNPGTLPSTLKILTARAGVTILPGPLVTKGSSFSNWITVANLLNAEISGLQFQAPSAIYSGLISPGNYGGLTVLNASGCSNTRFEDLVMTGSGYTGVSLALGTNNKVLKCNVTDWRGNGIQVSGASLLSLDTGTEVAGCYTEGNGTSSVAHGVAVLFGIDFNVHHNRAKNAGTFGFAAALCEGGIMNANQSFNSIHEGLNVEDSNHVKVLGNTARWDSGGGPSIDFGMSFFGNTRNCIGLEVIGNKAINSGSSGFCYAGSTSFGVQHSPMRDNFAFNCNAKQAAVAGGADNLAGILLSATLTQSNPIAGNTVIDTVGTLTYGIAELNFGTGVPSSNEITSNRTFGAFAGGSAIHANNASTKTALNTPQL